MSVRSNIGTVLYNLTVTCSDETAPQNVAVIY